MRLGVKNVGNTHITESAFENRLIRETTKTRKNKPVSLRGCSFQKADNERFLLYVAQP
jgi:hypothetical protein